MKILLLLLSSIVLLIAENRIVIHSHTLPQEPNPKINNATLLGIDAIQNDWGEQGVEFNIYASGPTGADTPWNIYTDPIVNLAKSLLL